MYEKGPHKRKKCKTDGPSSEKEGKERGKSSPASNGRNSLFKWDLWQARELPKCSPLRYVLLSCVCVLLNFSLTSLKARESVSHSAKIEGNPRAWWAMYDALQLQHVEFTTYSTPWLTPWLKRTMFETKKQTLTNVSHPAVLLEGWEWGAWQTPSSGQTPNCVKLLRWQFLFQDHGWVVIGGWVRVVGRWAGR